MSLDHARFVLLTLSLALVSGTMAMAHAQSMPVSDNAPRGGTSIYVCKDENGRVISSDQPIDACARRNMRELNRDGSVRRVLPPPLTRQQEREVAQQALVRQEQERALKAQQAHDRHLLLTYKTPEDLRKRQEQQIQLIDEEISAAMRRILVLDQNLKEEREQAAEWQKKQDRPNARLPYAVQQRISSIANAILAEDALIQERRNERTRLNRDFEANAARLTELLAHLPAEQQEPAN